MSAPFFGVLQKLVATIAPWYLRRKNIGTLLESTAAVQDAAIESLAQGLRFSQPLRCDPSALPYLSRDRAIRIFETEPLQSKRDRLSQWLQLHRQFGTHQGEMRNLQPFFLPAVPKMRIVHQDGNGDRATWHTLDASGYSVFKKEPSNWNYDGQTAKWSRFWLIIYREAAMGYDDAAEWDDGTLWDDGTMWDGEPSAAQIADIVAAIRDAKSAHSRLAAVILTIGNSTFAPADTPSQDPDGWWDLPNGNWGTATDPVTGLPNRPPFASWIYDSTWT